MTWLRGQIGTLLTAVTMLVAVGISYGQLQARQLDLCRALEHKADKAVVEREMDQIHGQLGEINRKLDTLILQRVDNP
jgi:hypothetical protein